MDDALPLPHTAHGPPATQRLTGAGGPGKNSCTRAQGITIPKSREAGATRCLSAGERLDQMWTVHSGMLRGHKKGCGADTWQSVAAPWKRDAE